MLEQTLDPLSDALGPTVADNFLGAVGALDESDLDPASTPVDVTVAVIDTSPPGVDGPEDTRSPHGEAMVDIIQSIACPDPDECEVTIRRVLGLPRG